MTDTPEILFDGFQSNTTATASNPQVLQLSSGNFLVAYMTQLGGRPGNDDGFRVRGQLFDPDGNPVGSEIAFPFPDAILTRDFDIISLQPGLVAVIADQKDGGIRGSQGGDNDRPFVRQFVIDETGGRIVVPGPLEDVGGLGLRFLDFTITNRAGDGYLTHVIQRIVADTEIGQDDETRLARLEGDILDLDGLELEGTLASTTLENGRIVLLIDPDGSASENGSRMTLALLRPDGSVLRDRSDIGATNASEFSATVTALKGGNFVLAFAEDDGDVDPVFQVMDANLDSVSDRREFGIEDVPGRSNNNEPAIAPLEDGGFIIFYDKDAGVPQIRGQRFDAEGNEVGADFLVANENGGQMDATLLSDDRVAVSYAIGGAIKTVILDGQPEVIRGTDGNDRLNGSDEADIMLGLVGNDTISAAGGDDLVEGGSGNDIINGNAGNDRLLGDEGNDRLSGGGGDDVLDGGAGNDRLTGGGGSDNFIFRDGDGENRIVDFNALNDNEKIDLSGVTTITSFADLAANHMTQQGADVVISDLNPGTTAAGPLTITLAGVDIADLDANDFLF
ncbi:MAG: hypothetical protein AAFY74_16730 [Pseudomonadota bacterium]